MLILIALNHLASACFLIKQSL